MRLRWLVLQCDNLHLNTHVIQMLSVINQNNLWNDEIWKQDFKLDFNCRKGTSENLSFSHLHEQETHFRTIEKY